VGENMTSGDLVGAPWSTHDGISLVGSAAKRRPAFERKHGAPLRGRVVARKENLPACSGTIPKTNGVQAGTFTDSLWCKKGSKTMRFLQAGPVSENKITDVAAIARMVLPLGIFRPPPDSIESMHCLMMLKKYLHQK